MEARCRRTRSPVRRRCCGRSGMTRAWERDANAPYDTVVEVLTYGGKRFHARLLHDASMQEAETPCEQWQAEEIGRANVCTPVTNAQLLSRVLPVKKTDIHKI